MMIRKLMALAGIIGISAGGVVAQKRTCGTMAHVKNLEQKQPNLRINLQQQAQAARFAAKNGPGLLEVITIPVVVHVVYYTATQNISAEQVQSQIEVLNKDFRRQNVDRVATPALFEDVAADAEIEFALAKRTPEGEPTTGITRTQTSVNGFSIYDEAMKFDQSKGKSAWDTKKYLNIWVVALDEAEGVLGYAQFPNEGSPQTDGVVIDYQFFGTTGTAKAPFDKGRTTTHEVGHWLNLFHIWGDNACGDDAVADTPTQQEENYGCPSFPNRSCNNTSDMFMNYMDYTDDACMNLFTKGQKNVMQFALRTYRPDILASEGEVEAEVPAIDAALIGFTWPANTLCTATFAPVLQLRNRGSQTLTAATIQYQLDNESLQTFTWTGSLASFTTTTITLPIQALTALGTHITTGRIITRNNAATDANAGNGVFTLSFTYVQGAALPISQSFEATTFPPAGWVVNNPDNWITWARTTKAAKTGSASVYMQNKQYEANGPVDELALPPLNLASRSTPTLTFQLAYSLLSASGYSDVLEVWVSTDCGANYQRVYQKRGRALTTATPYYTTNEFIPTSAQWRLETIDLSAFATATTAYIKFRHITDFENNLYLDDIKVDGIPLGTAENLASQAIQVAPNPTTGPITITSPEAAITSIQVCNAVGQVVQEQSYDRSGKGQPLQLSLQNNTPNGLYLLKLMTDKGAVVRRVLVTR